MRESARECVSVCECRECVCVSERDSVCVYVCECDRVCVLEFARECVCWSSRESVRARVSV